MLLQKKQFVLEYKLEKPSVTVFFYTKKLVFLIPFLNIISKLNQLFIVNLSCFGFLVKFYLVIFLSRRHIYLLLKHVTQLILFILICICIRWRQLKYETNFKLIIQIMKKQKNIFAKTSVKRILKLIK